MARFSVLAALAGSVLVVVVAGAQAALVTPNPVLVGAEGRRGADRHHERRLPRLCPSASRAERAL